MATQDPMLRKMIRLNDEAWQDTSDRTREKHMGWDTYDPVARSWYILNGLAGQRYFWEHCTNNQFKAMEAIVNKIRREMYPNNTRPFFGMSKDHFRDDGLEVYRVNFHKATAKILDPFVFGDDE